jgi:hypothetical protein
MRSILSKSFLVNERGKVLKVHPFYIYRFSYILCGSLPWEPSTGYQIATEVTVTQTGIEPTT